MINCTTCKNPITRNNEYNCEWCGAKRERNVNEATSENLILAGLIDALNKIDSEILKEKESVAAWGPLDGIFKSSYGNDKLEYLFKKKTELIHTFSLEARPMQLIQVAAYGMNQLELSRSRSMLSIFKKKSHFDTMIAKSWLNKLRQILTIMKLDSSTSGQFVEEIGRMEDAINENSKNSWI
jgi:hypothetical protein